MAREAKKPNRFAEAAAVGADHSRRGEVQAEREERARRAEAVPIDQIGDRPGGDTRTLKAKHVVGLAFSIVDLGLLEPIVVDRRWRLIAGAHRREALRLLALPDPKARAQHVERLGGPKRLADQARDLPATSDRIDLRKIPVAVLDFDAAEEPERAVDAEIAENAHRRDYSAEEVQRIAEDLFARGYRHRGGRPGTDQRRALPTLAALIGKSERTVRRILTEKEAGGTETRPNGRVKNPTEEDLDRVLRALRKPLADLAKAPKRGAMREPIELAGRLLEALDKARDATADATEGDL